MKIINLADNINQRMPPELGKFLQLAGGTAARLEQRLFLVGGVVRDLLLERPNLDLDLVVEGDAINLAEELAHLKNGQVMARSRFNTAKIRWERWTVDIAAARAESYCQPGALPSIQSFCDIHNDLIRRDFSINAMAVFLDPLHFGDLIDLYNGQADLKKGLIRVLHDQSFKDDATRIWRAVRYEQRLDFKIEKHTLALIQRDLPYLETISGDRLRGELELCMEEEKPQKSLRRADELGVLVKIHPHLKFGEPSFRLFAKARGTLEPFSAPEEFYLALLIYGLTTEELTEFNASLKIPKTAARVLQETLQLKDELPALAEKGLTNGAIYRNLHRFHQTAILVNLLVATSYTAKNRIELYLERLQHMRAALSGKDLLELGISAGPRVKEILELLLEARLDGLIKSRSEEIEFVKKNKKA
jgi:tRNA nucleotidyltransferase (CCA-adding enzyme)